MSSLTGVLAIVRLREPLDDVPMTVTGGVAVGDVAAQRLHGGGIR